MMSTSIKLALATAIFLWASAFVGIRAGLVDYSPEGLALLRYLIASLFMGIVYFRMPNRSPMPYFDIIALLLIGVVGIGLYNITLNYGELTVASGVASFIVSLSPIITALFATLFLGERITPLRMLGFFVSMAGVGLIVMGGKGGFKWEMGILYILIATVSGAFYSVLQKPLLKKYNAIQASTYVIWGGTLSLLFFAPDMQKDWQAASWATTGVVVYLGIFPAAVGYIAWTYALARIPAARAVSFLYFMPFVATLLGWLCLGEIPTLLSITGGMLAILGVWLVNQSYAKALKQSAQPSVFLETS